MCFLRSSVQGRVCLRSFAWRLSPYALSRHVRQRHPVYASKSAAVGPFLPDMAGLVPRSCRVGR